MSDNVIVPLPTPFEDFRGYIQSLVDNPNQPIGSCQAIFSKAGTTRAAHWHKTDWHYVYVVWGEMDYYHQPVEDQPRHATAAPDCVRVNDGQMVFTPPRTWHKMVFGTDTMMLVMARNSRTQENYESDTVRETRELRVGYGEGNPMSWYLWVIAGLVMFLVLFVEGAYRVIRDLQNLLNRVRGKGTVA